MNFQMLIAATMKLTLKSVETGMMTIGQLKTFAASVVEEIVLVHL